MKMKNCFAKVRIVLSVLAESVTGFDVLNVDSFVYAQRSILVQAPTLKMYSVFESNPSIEYGRVLASSETSDHER